MKPMSSLSRASTMAAFLFIASSLATEVKETKIFHLGDPEVTGSGCDNAFISASDGDGETSKISILFPEYEAETGLSKNRVQKRCAISLPITVQKGFSVAIFKADYRGNVYVPNEPGSSAQFSAQYSFAGRGGPKRIEWFRRGFDSDFTITDEIPAAVYTPCRETEQILSIDTSILSKKKKSTEDETYVVIESLDLSNPVSANFYFKVKTCKNHDD